MALAVDMTFLTFTIVALTVGALKTGDLFQNTRNALAGHTRDLQTENMEELRMHGDLVSSHLYDACSADPVAAVPVSTVAVAPGGDGTHHTLTERN